jgi:hypothetical protein
VGRIWISQKAQLVISRKCHSLDFFYGKKGSDIESAYNKAQLLISTPKKPVRATHTPWFCPPVLPAELRGGSLPLPAHTPSIHRRCGPIESTHSKFKSLGISTKRTPLVAASSPLVAPPARGPAVFSATPPAHGPAARGRRSYNHRLQ